LVVAVFFGFIKLVIRKCSPVQVYLMDSANMRAGLQRIRERESGVQYFVEHHYGFFYILTNAPLEDGKMVADNYQLARCSVGNIASNKWQVCTVFSINIFIIVYYKWKYNFPSLEHSLNVKIIY
jgi:protease II